MYQQFTKALLIERLANRLLGREGGAQASPETALWPSAPYSSDEDLFVRDFQRFCAAEPHFLVSDGVNHKAERVIVSKECCLSPPIGTTEEDT